MSLKRARVFKHKLPKGELNVVSLMDILTTLLFFLLLAASFTRLASLDASGFISNKSFSDQGKKPTFTLEVIINDAKSASVWLGPLTGLRVAHEGELNRYLGLQFHGDAASGYTRKLEANDPHALVALIQQALIPIKKSFPDELTAVVAFTDRVPYQQVVDSIAGVKSLDDQHEAVHVSTAIGTSENTKVLFPEIVISEWGEGGA